MNKSILSLLTAITLAVLVFPSPSHAERGEKLQMFQNIMEMFFREVRRSQESGGYNHNPRRGYFLDGPNLHKYVSGHVITGVVIGSGSRWQVGFHSNGKVIFRYSDGTTNPGNWLLRGNSVCIAFNNGGSDCKMIFLNLASNRIEWVTASTRKSTSYLVAREFVEQCTDHWAALDTRCAVVKP